MGDIYTSTRTDAPAQTPDRARLFEIASAQGGYFTAEQAQGCGYSRALLSHYAQSGRFIRARRGLYRLREYPSSAREHVLQAWLSVGREVAIVSHESALELLDLSDVVPDAVHLTVPRFRRGLSPLPGVRIHTTTRPPGKADLVFRDGIAVTSATRSILDAAETGTAPEQIEMAVAQALDRGLVTARGLGEGAAQRAPRVARLIEDALQKVKS